MPPVVVIAHLQGSRYDDSGGEATMRMRKGYISALLGMMCAMAVVASAVIAADTWTAAPSMNLARSSPHAVLLSDGRVLVVGGLNNTDLSAAELYNPVTNTWSAAASMRTARESATLTVLSDGRALVAGGSSNGMNLATAEIFDPRTNTWTAAGSMIAARPRHTAPLLSD